MINYRHLSVGLIVAAAWLPWPTQAVEVEQLWLPKSYLRHLPRLYDAARLVEQSPQCQELLEGTSHLGRSSLEHPVFTIKCRNQAGQSFSMMVDGPSMKVVDETRPEGLVSFEQLEQEYEQEQERAREQQRKEEQLALLEQQSFETEQERSQWLQWWEREFARREKLWVECVEALEDRVGGMKALHWITDTRPEPEVGHEPQLDSHPPLAYRIDFDAESYYGEPLYYRARCQRGDEAVDLDIKARRDE